MTWENYPVIEPPQTDVEPPPDRSWVTTERIGDRVPPNDPEYEPAVGYFAHRRTDPACCYHVEPPSRLGRWWHDRQRGRSCAPCQDRRMAAKFGTSILGEGRMLVRPARTPMH